MGGSRSNRIRRCLHLPAGAVLDGRVDVASVRWLGSPAGRAVLRDLGPYDESAAVGVSARLRAGGLAPDLVAAALTQQRLRTRAREKFGELADGMLFTADGLEQATRFEIAAGHAERFAQASIATAHDLGCGIGSDAMALADLDVTVAAIDADPVTAAVADANLRPWPDSRARVGLAEDWVAPPGAGRGRVGAWLDPARRVGGVADAAGRTRRVFRLDDIAPSWTTVLSIAQAVPATGVKLSPSFPHDQRPRGAEAQWVSRAGELLECTVWFGPLARTRGRTARVLRPGQAPIEVTEDTATADVPCVGGVNEVHPWLYETDRALVQADLVGAVTAATDGRELEPGLGYVTAHTAYGLGYARRYAVRDVLPLNVKALRAWLRARQISGVTIKKRGVRLDEAGLMRQLKVRPGADATLLLTRVAGHNAVLVLDQD